ncbi:ABC transporter substrate-binding protein [Microbacterium sp. LWH7-1.2]|uniref:ABC transporter substrate-binding protein n=1 Tax=Microbacterium sp. LWH7-1.2 TaxID=3135257 RepID=UPI0031388137
MRSHRRAAAVGVVLLLGGLTACAQELPATVVPDTKVTVGWSGELTSMNALAAPTPGNLDIAAATRSGFGDTVDGTFVPDESFGRVTIVSDDPFTVRYDLAEPAWSDGIPLDAADLMLGWAATAGYFAEDESADAGAAEPDDVPVVSTVDEFARAIEVTFPHPTITWQRAVTVPVPAHVVGKRALGLDDAMEAKQAVIRAIHEEDASALAAIAAVWHTAFDVTEKTDVPADLLVSSGPFEVEGSTRSADGQSVTLVPNPSYRGAVSPQVARIDLVPPGDDPVTAIGDLVDVVRVAPNSANRAAIRELERRDFTVQTTHDGGVWAVLLDPAGVFAQPAARTAFLRMVPARELVEAAAGEWSSAYAATASMVSAPGSPAYEVVTEDSGFATSLGAPSEDPPSEREAAGVAPGTPVCVLYDRGNEFAVGAFTALRSAAGPAGWNVADCGSDDVGAAIGQRGWDAAIMRLPIPQTPAEIVAQWGSGGEASLMPQIDANRDALIAQLAQTVDVYEAREVLAQIEATIVQAAVARPLAVSPQVTIIDRNVAGVTARSGPVAPVMYGVAQWTAVP